MPKAKQVELCFSGRDENGTGPGSGSVGQFTIHDKSSSSPDKSVSRDGCLEEGACALLKSGTEVVHVFSFLKEKSQVV